MNDTRTDIHRPSVINPEEYSFVACDYFGLSDPADSFGGYAAERRAFHAHQAHTGGKTSSHDHGGTCHICGAHASYVARFYHEKSNSYIITGLDCAQKLDLGNPALFASFRKKIKAGLEARAGKRKAQDKLLSNGLGRAWDIYEAPTGHSRPASIITDIVSKLVKYGSLSEKQYELIAKLIRDIEQEGERAAQRELEKEAAAPVPVSSERIDIEGEVLSTKVVDGNYGSTLKCLVRHATGYKLWGTVPGSLGALFKGDVITFSAKVEASHDDPKFGFFSRPTKARLVRGAETKDRADYDRDVQEHEAAAAS